MSPQLERDRPLWQLCIADGLDDGRIGVVGKAHHCMVDGIAAVELAALLLDPTPEPSPPPRRTAGARRRYPTRSAGSPAGCSTRCGPTSACCACPRARCARRRTRCAWRRTGPAPRVRDSACCAPRARAPRQRAAVAVPAPGRRAAAAFGPAADQDRVRHDGQRRDARGRRRRDAAPLPAARRAPRAPEGDGAGQRPRGGRRLGQPHLVHVREPALRRARPGAPAAVDQPGDHAGASGTARRTGSERRSTRSAISPSRCATSSRT